MLVLDIIVYISMAMIPILGIFLFIAKKRMDNNEPVAGWKRKQYLQEIAAKEGGRAPAASSKARKKNQNPNVKTIKDLIGIKNIEYGIFEKNKNEYSIILSTDSVNFHLLNPSERATIILGYQQLFRVINFPVQVLGQAVRQDLRKDENRFKENLKDANFQTKDYNERVISYIKHRTEEDFRITSRIYYVISFVYEPSKMGKLSPEQRERRIVETLYAQAIIVSKMLKRARIESEILPSLEAMETLKRALNRDRMLNYPIETVVEPGREKVNQYISADPTSFPFFNELVQDPEEARQIVLEA